MMSMMIPNYQRATSAANSITPRPASARSARKKPEWDSTSKDLASMRLSRVELQQKLESRKARSDEERYRPPSAVKPRKNKTPNKPSAQLRHSPAVATAASVDSSTMNSRLAVEEGAIHPTDTPASDLRSQTPHGEGTRYSDVQPRVDTGRVVRRVGGNGGGVTAVKMESLARELMCKIESWAQPGTHEEMEQPAETFSPLSAAEGGGPVVGSIAALIQGMQEMCTKAQAMEERLRLSEEHAKATEERLESALTDSRIQMAKMAEAYESKISSLTLDFDAYKARAEGRFASMDTKLGALRRAHELENINAMLDSLHGVQNSQISSPTRMKRPMMKADGTTLPTWQCATSPTAVKQRVPSLPLAD